MRWQLMNLCVCQLNSSSCTERFSSSSAVKAGLENKTILQCQPSLEEHSNPLSGYQCMTQESIESADVSLVIDYDMFPPFTIRYPRDVQMFTKVAVNLSHVHRFSSNVVHDFVNDTGDSAQFCEAASDFHVGFAWSHRIACVCWMHSWRKFERVCIWLDGIIGR